MAAPGVNTSNEGGLGNTDNVVNVPNGCYANGETSLPIRIALANGATVTSLVGYTLAYNTLDNNRNPTSGLFAELKQDFAGVGGDVNFIRSSADVRNYYEVFPDVVGVLHLQGGVVNAWGGTAVALAGSIPDGREPCSRLCPIRHRAARLDVAHPRCARWQHVLGR